MTADSFSFASPVWVSWSDGAWYPAVVVDHTFLGQEGGKGGESKGTNSSTTSKVVQFFEDGSVSQVPTSTLEAFVDDARSETAAAAQGIAAMKAKGYCAVKVEAGALHAASGVTTETAEPPPPPPTTSRPPTPNTNTADSAAAATAVASGPSADEKDCLLALLLESDAHLSSEVAWQSLSQNDWNLSRTQSQLLSEGRTSVQQPPPAQVAIPTGIARELSARDGTARDIAKAERKAAKQAEKAAKKAEKKATKKEERQREKEEKKALVKNREKELMHLREATSTDKRPARVRTVTQAISDRLNRALTQRMFMVDRTVVSALESKFQVLGSTGNVYTITVGPNTSCDCPDAAKGNLCKHVIFVLVKVLGVPSKSQLIPQKGFLKSELQAIFRHAPDRTHTSVLANQRVRDALAGGSSPNNLGTTEEEEAARDAGGEDEEDGGHRNSLDDDCAICCEQLKGGSLAVCDSCKNALHRTCWNNWAQHHRKKEEKVPCPLCRQPFAGDRKRQRVDASPGDVSLLSRRSTGMTGSSASLASAPTIGREGYINVAGMQEGVAHQRDTTTYRPSWEEEYYGRRYRGRRYDDDDEDY